LKRTRRVEVIRYTRRVDAPDENSGVGIDELLAIAQSQFTFAGDEPLALPEPIPVNERPSTLRSRARRLLKKSQTQAEGTSSQHHISRTS